MIEIRALRQEEREEVLRLWCTCFGAQLRDYFDTYFTGDPLHRDEFTRVALVEGRIASAVHLCDRPVVLEGKPFRLGGVANVATLPEYRRQGLSHALLEDILQVMEAHHFHLSLLFTGIYHHYARHGWFQVPAPAFRWTLGALGGSTPPYEVHKTLDPFLPVLEEVYQSFGKQTPFYFNRPSGYWSGWLPRRWVSEDCLIGFPDFQSLKGYAFLRLPENQPDQAFLREIAFGEGAGSALLRAIGDYLLSTGRKILVGRFLPPPLKPLAMDWGKIEVWWRQGAMLRGIGGHQEEVLKLAYLVEQGLATWWEIDDF